MARTRWPPDLATPASGTGQADQTGHAGGCQKNLGPADRSIPRTARSASADSEVRPGPRPPTLRPNQSKTTEQGRSTIHILPADYALPVDGEFAAAERHRTAGSGAVCRALSFSCTNVALPAASPARSQVHAPGGHTEHGTNGGRRPASGSLLIREVEVQARFRAARDAARHGYRSDHGGDADHVTGRVRTARGFGGGWCRRLG
jgi:hypothetical protein